MKTITRTELTGKIRAHAKNQALLDDVVGRLMGPSQSKSLERLEAKPRKNADDYISKFIARGIRLNAVQKTQEVFRYHSLKRIVRNALRNDVADLNAGIENTFVYCGDFCAHGNLQKSGIVPA